MLLRCSIAWDFVPLVVLLGIITISWLFIIVHGRVITTVVVTKKGGIGYIGEVVL